MNPEVLLGESKPSKLAVKISHHMTHVVDGESGEGWGNK